MYQQALAMAFRNMYPNQSRPFLHKIVWSEIRELCSCISLTMYYVLDSRQVPISKKKNICPLHVKKII